MRCPSWSSKWKSPCPHWEVRITTLDDPTNRNMMIQVYWLVSIGLHVITFDKDTTFIGFINSLLSILSSLIKLTEYVVHPLNGRVLLGSMHYDSQGTFALINIEENLLLLIYRKPNWLWMILLSFDKSYSPNHIFSLKTFPILCLPAHSLYT